MTLQIRPVKLNKSIYVRVPSDIADLIGINDNVEFALTLKESEDGVALVYSMKHLKSTSAVPAKEILDNAQPEN